MNIARAGPSRQHLKMYNAALNTGGADVRGHIVQCTARYPAGRLEDPGRAPTGHLEDPGRAPAGHLPGATCAPTHRTEHVSLTAGILTGALHFTRPIFSGHLPGAAEYVTTHAVEMNIGRFPYGLLIHGKPPGTENRTGPGLYVT